MVKKHRLVIAAVAIVVIAGAGGAFAASKLDSPSARSQAIINDAAGQLNIDPAKLSDALKKAIDNQIDASVKDGKLTAEQGAALKKRVDSGETPLLGGLGLRGLGLPFGGRQGFNFGHRLFGASLDAAASYLGLTSDQLRTELQSGKTLAQVATAHNKTADGLVTALLADGKKHLDAAVSDGKLTAAQEQTILDKLKTTLTAVVNGKRSELPGPGLVPHAFGLGGPGRGFGFHGFRFRAPGARAPASATTL